MVYFCCYLRCLVVLLFSRRPLPLRQFWTSDWIRLPAEERWVPLGCGPISKVPAHVQNPVFSQCFKASDAQNPVFVQGLESGAYKVFCYPPPKSRFFVRTKVPPRSRKRPPDEPKTNPVRLRWPTWTQDMSKMVPSWPKMAPGWPKLA